MYIYLLFLLLSLFLIVNKTEKYTNNTNIYGFLDGWERDYLKHLTSKAKNKKIYVFNSRDTSYKKLKKIVKKDKPDVIIHLSDEFGRKPQYDNISKFTKLYLRQHYHSNYPKLKNINIIPLGYQKDMFDTIPLDLSLKKIKDRKYKWSFIGDFSKNEDRKYMIKTLNSIPNNLIKNKIKPKEMKEIYLDSVFVPNSKGNFKLDCFRLYEASACGAIPIVVGNSEERKELITNQGNPPWLECDTWEDAKQMILTLEEDELQNKQDEIVKWWNTRLNFLIDLISKA